MVIVSRFIPLPAIDTTISVTLTGTGNRDNCYATIGGTKRYGAGTYEVEPGDAITFGVYGYSATYYGEVRIDGTQVLSSTARSTKTYDWTVPGGKKKINISMTYTSTSSRRNGRITVTTE